MARPAIALGVLPLVLTLVFSGCGGDGGGGGGGGTVSPLPPVITTTNTMIYVGQTVTFNATGNGTINWGGDAPGVATVDATTGRVTGVGVGRVTIWAENGGGRTTRLLRGLPSYAGTWLGTYTITRCRATGDFVVIKFCGDIIQEGQNASIGLSMSQVDDRVTGTLVMGTIPGTLNSTAVLENGQLPLTGTLTSTSVTVRVENATFDSPTPGTMTGTFDQNWTDSGVAGSGTLSCSIRDMSRISGGPSLSTLLPGAEHLSLEEMVRRVLRR